ncbi:MAG TPA: glycosyltransferase family 39 protein, partial [Methylomirabilota bacterium]
TPVADRDRRHRTLGALLVCAVATLLIVPAVGRQYITTSDEARFVLIARDMLDRGVWFDAVVREKHYRNKPPLYPWTIAAVARAGGGISETAAALPIALAAITAAVATFWLAESLFGVRAGIAAGLVLITSHGFFQHSREMLPDMLVVAFATLAAWTFWRSTDAPDRRGWLGAFWIAVAMGCFAKGPAGLLPVLPAAVWLWSEHGPRGLQRLASWAGLGAFGAISLVWIAPFLSFGASSFASDVVVNNWLSWYFGIPRPARLGNSALDAVVGFLPWTLPLLVALPVAWRARRDPAVRYALTCSIVPLLVVLLAENHRRRYLLPVYPGLALIIGWWATTRIDAAPAARRMVAWMGLAGVAVGVTVCLVKPPGWLVSPRSWAAVPLAVGAAALAVALFVGLRRARPGLLIGGVAGATLLLFGWTALDQAAWVNRTQDFPRLAARVERHARGGDVAVYGGRYFPLDFYLGRPLVRLRNPQQLNDFLRRAGAPSVVLDDRAWRSLRSLIEPPIVELDTLPVRAWKMRVVRRADAPGPTVGLAPAPR